MGSIVGCARPFEVRRLTPEACDAWLERYKAKDGAYTPPNAKKSRAGTSPSTINKAITFLRGVLDTAVAYGICQENAAAGLVRIPPKKKVLPIPTQSQFKEMVAEIRKGAGWGRRASQLVEGMAYSGMRVGEIRLLCWKHIDLEGKILTVPGTKTDSSLRSIPLFPSFEKLVLRIRSEMGGLKPDPERVVFKAKEASVSLAKACRKVGVPHMTHHDLRHFFATTALQKGVDVVTVAGWLGHNDNGVLLLRTYGHYRAPHAATMAQVMNFD